MTIGPAARRAVDLRFVARGLGALALPVWFLVYDLLVLQNLASHDFLFIDVEIYRSAAAVAIAGGDPWSATVDGVAFAAPPPSLLPFMPLVFVPLPVATVVTVTTLVAGAVFAVRRLQLPLWWLLFPPIFEGLAVGNLDVLVLTLLLVDGPAAGLAGVVKVYGVVPLVLQRRWTPVLVAGLVSLLTLPWWPAFLANLATIVSTLDAQSQGFSAWATWFMVPTLMALWVLRRRGAEWLVVPAIWPNTQTHYGAMSLPALSKFPVAAAIVGLGTPLAPPLAVVIAAAQAVLERYRSRTSVPTRGSTT
jgi:hypothetical protein